MANDISTLKSMLRSAAADGKVRETEANDLVKQARSNGGVTDTEERLLKNIYAEFKDGFEAPATKAFDTLFSNIANFRCFTDSPDVDASAPARPTIAQQDLWGAEYSDVGDGQLVVDGFTADDVIQGSLGDCYVIASLSALAVAQPDVLKNAIKANGDGTYTVNLFDRAQGAAQPTPVSITVDDAIPTMNGRPIYSRDRDGGEKWVALFEKAFAQWKGGYEALDQGGYCDEVISAITGRAATREGFTPGDTNGVFERMKTAFAEGKAVTAGTTEDQNILANTDLSPGHAYAVLGLVEENGQKFVELRNPWGVSSASSNGFGDDGRMKIPADQFARCFDTLMMG